MSEKTEKSIKFTAMKKLFTLALGLLMLGGVAIAQNTTEQDPKAKKILDKLSKEMKSYSSISIEFKSTIKGSDINESSNGKAGIKGNSYFYKDDQQKIWSDGESVWNLPLDEDVCYKTEVEEGEDAINPKKLLTIWEDGFKYKYIGETTKGGVKVDEIKLYPKNPGKSQYHQVKMYINKSTGKIHSMNIKTKEGITLGYTITKFTPNVELKSSQFKFDPSKHPGIEVEEL